MKPTYFKIVFLVILLIATINIQIASNSIPEVFASSTDESLITSLDMTEMSQIHLPDFDLVKKRPMWNLGREFVYKKTNSENNLFIVVGLHASPDEVEELVLNYLGEISIVMSERPINGLSIGDRLWWWSPTSDSNNVTNIVFTRKNALFIMNSHKYDRLVYLAKSIDDDLAKGESYVVKGANISLPQIDLISLEKTIVRKGDSVRLTVNARDPKNEKLEFQFQPGLIKDKTDPENVFIFRASQDFVPGTLIDSHTIKVVAINESNVVSRISATVVKCIQ